MKVIRAAVIGLAWGQLHIDALRRLKNVELIGVFDSDHSRAETIAKNAHVPRFFRNQEELLSQTDLDLVTVATPPATQKDIALKVMSAKKSLYCETPAGLNARDAQSLYETAQKLVIRHAVAFQTRYLPSYAYAKELIDEDYLGKFLRASITLTMAKAWGTNGNWAADDSRGGGILSGVASHFIDALQWWFGPIESVMADRQTLFSDIRQEVLAGKERKVEKWRATADDSFLSLFRFENGGTAILNFISGARHEPGWTIGLYGSRGTLVITSGTLSGKLDTERDFGLIEIPRRLELPDRPREPLMWASVRLLEGLTAQIRGEKLEGSSLPSLRDAVRNHKVMDAIRRSSDDMMWASV